MKPDNRLTGPRDRFRKAYTYNPFIRPEPESARGTADDVARSEHGVALDELQRLREDPDADLALAKASQEFYVRNRAKLQRRLDLEEEQRRREAARPKPLPEDATTEQKLADPLGGQAFYEANKAALSEELHDSLIDREIERLQASKRRQQE